MDFAFRRIHNLWILFGIVIGVIVCLLEGGIAGLGMAAGAMCIPLILLMIHEFGVLGGGDIKLFMVTGLFMGSDKIIQIIILSIFLGAMGALWKLHRTKGFRKRFGYFFSYLQQVVRTGSIKKYGNGYWDETAVIHFSLFIFLATVLIERGYW